MGEQKRKPEFAGLEMFANLVRELQQQSSQPGSHRFREGNAACVLQREPVFLADALHGAHLGFLVAAQEVEEPFALNGPQLCGGQDSAETS